MMKSLLLRSATLGLIGTSLIGLGLGQNLKAWALPTEQIVEKLNPVPVFTVADEQGAPLVASGQDNAKVAGVFISQADANNFVSRLQTQNPDLASKVKVVPVSLGEVYKLDQANQAQTNSLNFTYVPTQTEVESAKTILSEDGKQYQGGVPLFVAKGGQDDGYLTIEKDSQQVIPFFFEKQQLESVIEKFKQQKPELADTVDIEVVLLEGVIDTLQNSNDAMLSKIVLVPTAESIKFIQENVPAQEGQPETQPGQ
ncbi:Tic22 family protein [Stanieria sp. NIES-3757]|nr:Tic22 family protein [Stanieria sp. NIES-3757]